METGKNKAGVCGNARLTNTTWIIGQASRSPSAVMLRRTGLSPLYQFPVRGLPGLVFIRGSKLCKNIKLPNEPFQIFDFLLLINSLCQFRRVRFQKTNPFMDRRLTFVTVVCSGSKPFPTPRPVCSLGGGGSEFRVRVVPSCAQSKQNGFAPCVLSRQSPSFLFSAVSVFRVPRLGCFLISNPTRAR
jgi:hypothetical protein